MLSDKEILNIVTCNGQRELTEERALQAMNEYAIQYLLHHLQEAYDISSSRATYKNIGRLIELFNEK